MRDIRTSGSTRGGAPKRSPPTLLARIGFTDFFSILLDNKSRRGRGRPNP